MEFNYNDGGRKDAGYRGIAKDCVCRSIAIVKDVPYVTIYSDLAIGHSKQRKPKKAPKNYKGGFTADEGIWTTRKWFKDYMLSLGFEWVATSAIGSSHKTHLNADELPGGRIIVKVSKHYAAVIDGVLHDTYDCSRGGTRLVYGYWKLKH